MFPKFVKEKHCTYEKLLNPHFNRVSLERKISSEEKYTTFLKDAMSDF